jgi:DNA-binding NarL/FixJ family response regulator
MHPEAHTAAHLRRLERIEARLRALRAVAEEQSSSSTAACIQAAIESTRSEIDAGAGTRASPHELTSRQREIARLVACGLTDRQIAIELFLSKRTVEGHVGRVLGRLGFRTRLEIVEWYQVHVADDRPFTP